MVKTEVGDRRPDSSAEDSREAVASRSGAVPLSFLVGEGPSRGDECVSTRGLDKNPDHLLQRRHRQARRIMLDQE